jgi:hypothetical protein
MSMEVIEGNFEFAEPGKVNRANAFRECASFTDVLLDAFVWEVNTGAPTLVRISSGCIIRHKGQERVQRRLEVAVGLGNVGLQLGTGLPTATRAKRTFY